MKARILLSMAVGLMLASAAASAAGMGAGQGRMFQQIDRDGDGYLSREEYRHLMQMRKQHQKQMKGHGKGAAPDFDAIDLNGDGRLSREEMRSMRKKQLRGMLERHQPH